MTKFEFVSAKPGLLVSVRNAEEALAALAGRADVIDVKEPNRGSLGAADRDTLSDIVRVVTGRAPVSAAMGELVEHIESPNGRGTQLRIDGVSLFKIGLANCAGFNDWPDRWRRTVATIASASSTDAAHPVAVVYADWQAAKSPSPREILGVAVEFDCPALLIDTWSKSSGSLFDHWPVAGVQRFLAEARSHDIAIALAGSLTGKSVLEAARLVPDLVAVRAAACDGGRQGTVSETRVRELKNVITTPSRDVPAI
jgi:uncharacterized protein (UPF0264 family)